MPTRPLNVRLSRINNAVGLKSMRVRVYLRRKGEPNFRDLGSREMGSVPPEDAIVVINVEGATTRARVERSRSFEPIKHQHDRDPEVYLEIV